MNMVFVIVMFGVGAVAQASPDSLYQEQATLTKIKNTLMAYSKMMRGKDARIKNNHSPPFYQGAYDEWGEQEVAEKWTKGYCNSVLEFGGGGGAVSTIIQKNLDNRKNHVVIQPDSRQSMFGGYKQHLKNRQSCKMSFTAIDHILVAGEQNEILQMVSEPFD